jgi:hypothetical protein
MNSKSLWFFTQLCLALTASFSGCSNRVATYPVSGTVRFDDGEPVRIGIVEFRCQETGLSARAKLNDEGSFSLGTFGDTDGAPAGTYKIIVVQFFDTPPRKHEHTHTDHEADDHADHDHAAHDSHEHEPDARVAAKFSDYSTSPLRATVSSDAVNRFDLVVSRFSSGTSTATPRGNK